MIPRPCAIGRCRNVTPCPVHPRGRQWVTDPLRPSPWRSGYDAEHQRLRAELLDEEPFCRIRAPGCTIDATVADHIVPLRQGGARDRSNLQPACRHCHAIKSARER
jgi:5-methylcytosine-specific restriction enzyme A